MESTKQFRKDHSKLFLSWKTHKPVVKSSLARWLTQVLHLSGLDTSTFKAHSYRGAGLSYAYCKGASIEKIVKADNWKDSSTFKDFYLVLSYEPEIGKLILSS